MQMWLWTVALSLTSSLAYSKSGARELAALATVKVLQPLPVSHLMVVGVVSAADSLAEIPLGLLYDANGQVVAAHRGREKIERGVPLHAVSLGRHAFGYRPEGRPGDCFAFKGFESEYFGPLLERETAESSFGELIVSSADVVGLKLRQVFVRGREWRDWLHGPHVVYSSSLVFGQGRVCPFGAASERAIRTIDWHTEESEVGLAVSVAQTKSGVTWVLSHAPAEILQFGKDRRLVKRIPFNGPGVAKKILPRGEGYQLLVETSDGLSLVVEGSIRPLGFTANEIRATLQLDDDSLLLVTHDESKVADILSVASSEKVVDLWEWSDSFRIGSMVLVP